MKYGKDEDRRMWLKLHLTCGVKTNIVTAVQVSDGCAHDYPFFRACLIARLRLRCPIRLLRQTMEF